MFGAGDSLRAALVSQIIISQLCSIMSCRPLHASWVKEIRNMHEGTRLTHLERDYGLQSNLEVREFLHSAVEALTFWNLNDMDSIENVMQPLLAQLSRFCHRMKWTQACLNIVARLDHEPDITNSALVSQVSGLSSFFGR